MGYVSDWLNSTSRPNLVRRDFVGIDYVELTVDKNTTSNWSYTFTVSEKIGPRPKNDLGTWVISKQNWNRRDTIIPQIENAYDEALTSIGGREEEVEETDITSTVREQTVGGITITMTRTENSYDMRAGDDRVFYTVSNTSPGSSSAVFDTQEEAEERFDYQVSFFTPRPQTSTVYEAEYRGVNIRFQDTNMPDGTDYISEITNQSMDSVFLTGAITEELPIGSEVSFRDGYGVQEFGVLTGDEEADMTILEAYIDARLDPRPDPNTPKEEYGLLPVYSWGWYRDNNDSPNCPFSKTYFENVFTVSETNGRILALRDDDFIAQGFESGMVNIKVKDGYRVRLKVMTQNRGYLSDNIPNLETVGMDFETYNISEAQVFGQASNYTDTEKVKIDLFGGDELQISIDGDSRVKTFYITQNGERITTGGGQTINDETFLAVIEVERFAPQNGGGGGNGGGGNGGGGDTDSEPMTWLPIVLGSVLILGVLYMVFSVGGEE
jgi:hypothetical protein